MPITPKTINQSDSFEQWIAKTNQVSSDAALVESKVGDLSTLLTTLKTSIVDATNELVIKIGDLTALDTTAKTSIVAAINELKAYLNIIGVVSTLKTTNKTTIVASINEVFNKIGNLADLDTVDKTTIVDAINEVVGSVDDLVGDLNSLTTIDQSSAVAAINEINSELVTGIKEAQLFFNTTPAIRSTSLTAISVAAGSAIINGTKRTWASALTKTSITGYSDGLVYIYLYNNGGTVEIALSSTAPTYSTSSREWYLSGEPEKRCIGWYVNYSNSILPFIAYYAGKEMKHFYNTASSPTQFSGANHAILTASYTSTATALNFPSGTSILQLAPTALMTSWYCGVSINMSAAGDDLKLAISSSSIADNQMIYGSEYIIEADNGRTSGSSFRPAKQWLPFDVEHQPRVIMLRVNGSPTATIECWGAAFRP